MNRKSAQVEQLLEIKELRRRLAEKEAAKAHRVAYAAKIEVQRAKENERYVRLTAHHRRRKRLKQLFDPKGNKSVQNVLAANTHQITNEEIALSKDAASICIHEMEEAKQRAKLEQTKLAQSLRIKERTKKLCERLVKLKQIEQLRSE